ncbi:MAG: methyl-accepting chemotaxis protein [Pseudomonadota bacterium]
MQETHDLRKATQAAEQTEAVKAIQHALTKLGKGDLTARIDAALPAAYDDMRIAFNAATRGLEAMVMEVSTKSDNMQHEVLEITASTEDLARRTEQQAATIGETSDALAALTTAVKNANETLTEANGFASNAQSNPRSSETVVTAAS